jgi:hypothetical protein
LLQIYDGEGARGCVVYKNTDAGKRMTRWATFEGIMIRGVHNEKLSAFYSAAQQWQFQARAASEEHIFPFDSPGAIVKPTNSGYLSSEGRSGQLLINSL